VCCFDQEPTKSKSLSLLKDFEFNKVNEDVVEELKYFQFKNKSKYLLFWGGLIACTLYTHNYATSNLSSVYQQALIKDGTSPFIALFSTNWDKKVIEVKKDFDKTVDLISALNQELKKIDVINNEYSLNTYLKTLTDDDIINVIKTSKDFKAFIDLENKLKIANSKESIVLNNNSYTIEAILDRLSSLDEQTFNEAVEEPLVEINNLKIVDVSKSELKEILRTISKNHNYYDLQKSYYQDLQSMLKASLEYIKKDTFSFSYVMSLRETNNISLADTKEILASKFNKWLEVKNKDVLKQKEKVDKLKKEIEDIEANQKARKIFITKLSTVNVENYIKNKEEIENLYDAIN
jgi:hypothetical protein